LILFFLFTLFFLIPKGVYVPANINIRVMSPDFFPRAVAIFVILMSLILALQNILVSGSKKRYPDQNVERKLPQEGKDNDKIRKLKIIKICVAIFLLFMYFQAVSLIGILPSSAIFLLAFSFLYGERRFKIIIPLAVFLPIILYFFFTRLANIPLPKGIFFE